MINALKPPIVQYNGKLALLASVHLIKMKRICCIACWASAAILEGLLYASVIVLVLTCLLFCLGKAQKN